MRITPKVVLSYAMVVLTIIVNGLVIPPARRRPRSERGN